MIDSPAVKKDGEKVIFRCVIRSNAFALCSMHIHYYTHESCEVTA